MTTVERVAENLAASADLEGFDGTVEKSNTGRSLARIQLGKHQA